MSLIDPPALARVIEAGATRRAADRAWVLIHGRGRPAEEMLDLAARLGFSAVRPHEICKEEVKEARSFFKP